MTDKHAIQDVLSQYVRATDERNGAAQAKLFADNGMIRFFGRSGTGELAVEPVIGAARIRRHMEGFPSVRSGRTSTTSPPTTSSGSTVPRRA
jgi:hypothetical protein